MHNQPNLTFNTTYLGVVEIPLAIVRDWSAGVDDFNTLCHTERAEQRVRVELFDGTVLYGATNKFSHTP
jgi:hypothetical protein